MHALDGTPALLRPALYRLSYILDEDEFLQTNN